MKPSPGVIAVAVFAVLEGLLVCLLGLVFFLMLLLVSEMPPSKEMAEVQSVAWVMIGLQGVVCVAVGGWLIASAIGLLRLKNWARTSVMVLGGLIAVFALFGVLGALLMTFHPIPSPPDREIPGSTMVMFAWVAGTISAVQVGIGIWWMVLLSRPAVRRQFQPGATAESAMGAAGGIAVGPAPVEHPERPLSISVIAWLMVVSGALVLPFSIMDTAPAPVFGAVVEGWPAQIYYSIYSLAHIILGIGLLRLKPLFVDYSVWLYVFQVVSGVVGLLVPGTFQRYMKVVVDQMGEKPPPSWSSGNWELVFWGSYILGLLYVGVILWFLLRRRGAYLVAAEHKANPPSPGVAQA